jgi:spore maturation protein CgeB
VVLSNSRPACEQTDNIVVYIESKEDLISKMRYFIKNPDLIKQKQEEGYAFIRRAGTNQHAIDVFINRIQDGYGITA